MDVNKNLLHPQDLLIHLAKTIEKMEKEMRCMQKEVNAFINSQSTPACNGKRYVLYTYQITYLHMLILNLDTNSTLLLDKHCLIFCDEVTVKVETCSGGDDFIVSYTIICTPIS